MNVKDKPNKVSATLKVIVTGEFYDDDATEETLRFTVEQDLEDAGFDVDVALLKEQEAVVRCKDCKFMYEDDVFQCAIKDGYFPVHEEWFCADGKRKEGR